MTSDTRPDSAARPVSCGRLALAPEAPCLAPLCVPAVLESLDRVAEFVLAVGRAGGLDSGALYRLRLAADELATNIVMHGYRGAAGHLTVTGGVDADRVWVRFEDAAPAFDPRQGMHAPDLAVPLAEREVGGLGVFLALTAVDSFGYELLDGRNVSTLALRRGLHE